MPSLARNALCLMAALMCAAQAHGRSPLTGTRHLLGDEEQSAGGLPAMTMPELPAGIQDMIGKLTGSSGDDTSESAAGSADDDTPSEVEAAEPDANGDDCPTLAEVAAGVPELSTLVDLVTAEGGDILSAVTNPDTAVTVFAPTNDAFAKALEELQLTADDLIGNKELLGTVLKYHVHGSPAKSTDLTNGMILSTLAGVDLTVELEDGKVMIDGVGSEAQVIQPDVMACKSVVHVIDNVLLPVKPSEL